VFAATLGWLLLRERLGPVVLAGGATALAGAATLALARAQAAGGPMGSAEAGWIGDGLALAGALGYASYLLIVRALGSNVTVGAVMFWATLSAACVSLGLSFALNETMLPRSAWGWAMLIGLGLVVQVGGQGLIGLPIVVSTVLLWMQPLAAAALSWVLFGEALGPLAFAGAALILAGIYVVQRARS
jgi:drug/metabolite transporter (DMT)-like permease